MITHPTRRIRPLLRTLGLSFAVLLALAAGFLVMEQRQASAGIGGGVHSMLVVSDLNANAVIAVSTVGDASVLSDDALLQAPSGIARVPGGGYVVTSSRNGTAGAVIKIEKDGTTTVIVDGLPESGAIGVAVDPFGNYIVGNNECRQSAEDCTVMRITPAGAVSHVFSFPGGEQPGAVAIDANGDYIVGTSSGGLWRVTPAGAGELIAGAPDLNNAFGVAIDADGNYLVTDGNSDIVRKVTPAGVVTTYAQDATWGRLIGIAIGPKGAVVVSDESNHAVYQISEGGPSVEIYSGAPLSSPNGLLLLGPNRPGDVDCSNAVTAIDAALVLQLEAGLIAGLVCNMNADVTLDGQTNPVDALLILQFTAGLVPSLPIV